MNPDFIRENPDAASRCRPWQIRVRRPSESGFTRWDLLGVIVTILAIVAALAPALGRTASDSQAFRCMNNHRQLTIAWKLYSIENFDKLPSAEGSSGPEARSWMEGGMFFGQDSDGSLSDIQKTLARSPLWDFVGKQPGVFKCPADKSTVVRGGVRVPRVRSISMSQVFGQGIWLPSTTWRTYTAIASIVNPAQTFVFIDEHPDSINDAAFAVQCDGAETTAARIVDMPGSLHDGACALSLADGHVEIHRWTGTTIQPPVRYNGSLSLNIPAGDSWTDIRWLARNTTVRQ